MLQLLALVASQSSEWHCAPSQFCQMLQTPLERSEQLEQLRLLEHGVPIQVVTNRDPSPPGVDTMEQYEAFVERWLRNQPTC